MKGIVLAGGSGTRLYPLTMVTSKQLLPIYAWLDTGTVDSLNEAAEFVKALQNRVGIPYQHWKRLLLIMLGLTTSIC